APARAALPMIVLRVSAMRRLIYAAAVLFAAVPAVPAADTPKARKVDFAREVRPILARCFQCHGPDDKALKAKLRLDTRAGAVAAVVPGDPDKSELIARVISDNDKEVMPPKKVGTKLTASEVATLRVWIK